MTLFVGLTGGIASGKSSVLDMFAGYGAATVSADTIVHRMLRTGAVRQRIAQAFGPRSIGADGGVDRAYLAEVVFGDARRRLELEALLHPGVRASVHRWMTRMRSRGVPVAVAEIPLLFEAGYSADFDVTVVVCSEHRLQMRRLLNKGLRASQAQARIDAQAPIEDKIRQADILIDNNGSFEDLRSRVALAWGELQERLPEISD